jgi:hypothetical protein
MGSQWISVSTHLCRRSLIMDSLEFSTQSLSVVANFVTIEEAWYFLTNFNKNLSFVRFGSSTLRAYPKFEYAYWFDWVLVVEDLNIARNKIKNYFGNDWIESGDDEIWNAENRRRVSVPIWAILSAPNLITVDEAIKLNPEPQMQHGNIFISISTQGQITGIYPNSIIAN